MNRVISDYALLYPSRQIKRAGDFPLLWHRGKQILKIGDPGIAGLTGRSPEVLVLSDSPRFNLDRYLKDHRPEAVVADGSNYAYLVRLWEGSCARSEIRFHNTYRDGAFILPGTR